MIVIFLCARLKIPPELSKEVQIVEYDLPNRDDVREIVITKEAITEGTSPLIVTERARAKREA